MTKNFHPIRALIYVGLTLLTMSGGQAFGQQLEKLPETINSDQFDEISPVVSSDGHTLFFTRVGSDDFVRDFWIDSVNVYQEDPEHYEEVLKDAYSQIAGRTISNPTSSDFNQDIWIAESNLGFFDQLVHPGWPLNNALPNSICAITNQPNEFIVINRFPKGGGMDQGFSIVRRHRDGSFTFPEPLEIEDYYTQSSGVNLTLSPDNEVLFLSIEQEDSRGQNDLYICFRLDDGNWGAPMHLGSPINSRGMETNPALTEDMQTLFFTSDRPGSQGTDIYYSMRKDTSWLSWTTPQRLNAPINSPADDGQPHFNMATGYLYFTSNRDGSSDVFRLQLQDAPQQGDVVVSGRIINTASGEPVDATVLFGNADSQMARSFYVSSDGYYRLRVPKGETVPIHPEKVGFLGHHESVFFEQEIYYYEEQHLDLLLDPIEVDAKITMPPIFFEQSRAVILPKSYQTLEYLADILIDNPEIVIRIEGHTDNIGDKKDLKRLSEDRAKAVRNYLMGKGVARRRLQTYGFGDAQPVNANSNDTDRSENRRVEFRIIKIED